LQVVFSKELFFQRTPEPREVGILNPRNPVTQVTAWDSEPESSKDLLLTVKWAVIYVLRHKHLREECSTGDTTLQWLYGKREWVTLHPTCLAVIAGKLRANVIVYDELGWLVLKREGVLLQVRMRNFRRMTSEIGRTGELSFDIRGYTELMLFHRNRRGDPCNSRRRSLSRGSGITSTTESSPAIISAFTSCVLNKESIKI
jgi:hypothetical protein